MYVDTSSLWMYACLNVWNVYITTHVKIKWAVELETHMTDTVTFNYKHLDYHLNEKNACIQMRQKL